MRPFKTKNYTLDTTLTPIEVPSDLIGNDYKLVAACTSSGEFITWQRAPELTDTEVVTCLAGKEAMRITAPKDGVIFCAKVSSGSGTLEIEWWK